MRLFLSILLSVIGIAGCVLAVVGGIIVQVNTFGFVSSIAHVPSFYDFGWIGVLPLFVGICMFFNC